MDPPSDGLPQPISGGSGHGERHRTAAPSVRRAPRRFLSTRRIVRRIEVKLGERFGRFVIIAEAESRVSPSGNVSRQVQVRCDCGALRTVSLTSLRSGGTKSCGCIQRRSDMGRVKPGARFGSLTVVRQIGLNNGKLLVECVCDCGATSRPVASKLLDGKTKTCGTFGRAQVIAGHRHGRLVILREILSASGEREVDCQCDCGKLTTVRLGNLRSGNTQSCGCLGDEVRRQTRWQGGGGKYSEGRGYRGSDWNALAERVRTRDGNVCQRCGMTHAEHGRRLDVHHVIPFCQFGGDNANANRMSNLITLCRHCHQVEEWEWRSKNSVQFCLALDGKGDKGVGYTNMPSDLHGLTVNQVRITTRAPGSSNNSPRWNFDCLACGGVGIARRSSIVRSEVHDCGCRLRERRTASLKKIVEQRSSGSVWWVHGDPFRTLKEAGKANGVSSTTIQRWCLGKGPRRSPRSGCWYGPARP